jgi:hypothetical protein
MRRLKRQRISRNSDKILNDWNLQAATATYSVSSQQAVRDKQGFGVVPGGSSCTRLSFPCSENPESFGSSRNFRREFSGCALDLVVEAQVCSM